MFILDTNVVSEMRKGRSRRMHASVQGWLDSVDPSFLFVSVITLMELEIGVLLMERRDKRQGAVLRGWLQSTVLRTFAARILVVDWDIARRCAGLHVPDRRSFGDSIIAATAIEKNMTVVTRNVADFAGEGVAVFDPWASGRQ